MRRQARSARCSPRHAPKVISSMNRHRPSPYHGYHFRMLAAQGEHAAGGAYDYLVSDRMIGGFGLVAYPAEYGSTGVMTFIVNHDGVVFSKDLGPDTAKLAAEMTAFDPDESWKREDLAALGL